MQEESPVPFKDYFPNLSMSSYFWLIMALIALFFGFIGYFVGIRVSQLPSSVSSTSTAASADPYAPTMAPGNTMQGDDNDVDYSSVDGTFTVNTTKYDQLVIEIDSIKNGVKTNLDTDYRDITKPQKGIEYPYSFDRLDPYKSYIVSASACTTNTKTYALDCAKNIKITKCSGKVQSATCIIMGNGNETRSSGEVNFAIN